MFKIVRCLQDVAKNTVWLDRNKNTSNKRYKEVMGMVKNELAQDMDYVENGLFVDLYALLGDYIRADNIYDLICEKLTEKLSKKEYWNVNINIIFNN
jgi:hypothetical protein